MAACAGAAPQTITMDVLVANPEKFVGEHLRVRGKVAFDSTFFRDAQRLILMPVGCEASEGRAGDLKVTAAFKACYGTLASADLAWFVDVSDELDIAAGDILTIEATIGARGAGESRYFTFYGDPGQSSIVLPVISVEKEGQ